MARSPGQHRKLIQDEFTKQATQTPPDTAETIRELILNDADQHLSGTPIFRDGDGQLRFAHRMMTVVGRKP